MQLLMLERPPGCAKGKHALPRKYRDVLVEGQCLRLETLGKALCLACTCGPRLRPCLSSYQELLPGAGACR